jgi:hypothetical protein
VGSICILIVGFLIGVVWLKSKLKTKDPPSKILISDLVQEDYHNLYQHLNEQLHRFRTRPNRKDNNVKTSDNNTTD